MRKFDVITIGGATADLFFEVDDYRLMREGGKKLLAFEYGTKVGVRETSSAFGGGAANAAVAFSRLGFRTALVGAVGEDDRAERILKNLKNNKVDLRLIDKKKGEQSGVSFVLIGPDREHIVFTYRGANASLKIDAREKKKLEQAHWLYLTSLSDSWKSTLSTVFSSNCHIAWNPGREQLSAGKALLPFLKKTEVLLCNRAEALLLSVAFFGKKNTVPTQLLLKQLHSLGPRIVVITEGAKGARSFDGRSICTQKSLLVSKPFNTTGVGDAFGSSFIAGLEICKGDIQAAMKLGAINAAAVVKNHDAQAGLLSKSEAYAQITRS